MPTLEILRQRHPSWDQAEQDALFALYRGGKTFRAQLNNFLPQRPAEPPERHEARKREAIYRNYVGPVISFFASLLFASAPRAVAKDEKKEPVLEPGDFYNEFRDDCDGNGCDLDAFFKTRLIDAMVSGRSWYRVELPEDNGAPPENLHQFNERKLGDAWLTALDADQVLDWKMDKRGRFQWVLIHTVTCDREDIESTRNTITETWERIDASTVTTYRISYEKGKAPSPKQEIPRIGEPVPHRFGRVPVMMLALPPELWVASQLETPQLGHFRLTNAQTWGMTQTCYAMPVFNLAPQDEKKKRLPVMGTGHAITLGLEEQMEWKAPPDGPYAALSTEIQAHKDEIFRVAHQMALGVENNAAAVGRSAESKASDAEATRVVLEAYAKIVKACIESTYDLISQQRDDKYDWSIEGLDDFAAQDLGGLTTVLAQVEAAGGIPSPTFRKLMAQRLAESLLPDIDQETKLKIEQEIEDGIAAHEELADAMHAATVEGLNNPEGDNESRTSEGDGEGKPRKAAPRRGKAPAPRGGGRGKAPPPPGP